MALTHPQGPDPILTPLGESQARAANAGWKAQLKDHIPLPQSLYSSPLRRAARTLEITWGDILLKRAHHLGLPIRPIVSTVGPSLSSQQIKETLREMIGLHTCDRRSTKSLLANTFPTFAFEPSFTEHDILWDATYQETGTQEAMRLRFALNEIFATDPHTHIGITAHGGVIGAIFRAVGRRDFGVVTGGFVPIVVSETQLLEGKSGACMAWSPGCIYPHLTLAHCASCSCADTTAQSHLSPHGDVQPHRPRAERDGPSVYG
jgi:broad specificity phosphatase PhoE